MTLTLTTQEIVDLIDEFGENFDIVQWDHRYWFVQSDEVTFQVVRDGRTGRLGLIDLVDEGETAYEEAQQAKVGRSILGDVWMPR